MNWDDTEDLDHGGTIWTSSPALARRTARRRQRRAPLRNRSADHFFCAALLLAVAVVSAAAWARAGEFPNLMLAGGDEPLLVPPAAGFQAELVRLKLATSSFTALPALNGPARQTAELDLADLEAALDLQRTASGRGAMPTLVPREVTLGRYRDLRDRIHAFRETTGWDTATGPGPLASRALPFGDASLPPGLPFEFADYLSGAIAWYQRRTNAARLAWQHLLERPADERRFRSTWAAFMLGRSFAEEDRTQAIRHYRRVRELAKAGFNDSPGLATASLGWEAALEFNAGHYERAIELYLEQLAAGDTSAVLSLRWVAGRALADTPGTLRELAAHPRCQRVLTAYVISGGFEDGSMHLDGAIRETILDLLGKIPALAASAQRWHKLEQPGLRWLDTLDSARVKDADDAEAIALAAYQCGEFDRAARWLQLSRRTPLAQWLRAKLLIREGRLGEATALLAALVKELAPAGSSSNAPSATEPAGPLASLYVPPNSLYHYLPWRSLITSGQQLLGEWGAICLARGNYVDALDSFLRGGFWGDAAYVAERVLSVDELKLFVDQHWVDAPSARSSDQAGESSEQTLSVSSSFEARLRSLLARRLTRVARGPEATLYYPTNWQPVQAEYVDALKTARDEALPPELRANAFWRAARIAREHGMELLATEGEPDWALCGGSYDHGPVRSERAATPAFVRPSWDELRRGREHGPDPEERFHYRYRAASLAWEAARLMPNDSPETARVLCEAGSWLKNRDPKAADRFYKALVRRCGNTTLGQAADNKHWFPALDENGEMCER